MSNTPDHKKAITDHHVLDVIRNRWSPRAFEDKAVTHEQVMQLFEAARWAPSSYNEQPWRYLYVHRENTDAFQKMLSCLVPFNQDWAQHASVLMLGVVKNFSRDDIDQENRHAFHDLGAASMQLSLQATDMGLSVHQMGGIEPEKIIDTYQLPDGYVPVTALAIGYLGNPEQLSEDLQEGEKAPRARKPIAEIATENEWNIKK